jgi:hypothetical protein
VDAKCTYVCYSYRVNLLRLAMRGYLLLILWCSCLKDRRREYSARKTNRMSAISRARCLRTLYNGLALLKILMIPANFPNEFKAQLNNRLRRLCKLCVCSSLTVITVRGCLICCVFRTGGLNRMFWYAVMCTVLMSWRPELAAGKLRRCAGT